MAKKRRKPKSKPEPEERRSPTAKQIARAGEHIIAQRELLRPLIREAAKAGATEAIESCANFWNVSDGYKKYIEQQIELRAEELMAAVRKVVTELILVQNRRRK